jgi:predicted CXXCH cytochrome family protein
MNLDTGIAHRTTPAGSGELNACGGCHARRSVIADDATAATSFLDAYLPALLDPGLYHADGQIDGEVFEYGSFVQSRMYRAGVTCTNCHDPHTATLRVRDNTLCAQCHMPQKFDTVEHHHHQAGSAGTQCIECHMPAKTYMGVHRRRDHSFRVPRPDLSVKIGVPNTCTQCHADKSAAWAAQAIAAWFPAGRQTTSHYGLALQAGRSGTVDAEARLDALIHDASAPGIARATALRLLAPYATAASEPGIVASSSDPDPLVRRAVPATLAGHSSHRMVQTIASLLGDPVRSVRIETARALAGVDPRELTPAQQTAYDTALKELTAAEMVNADRPEVHLNLGLLAVRLGQADQAEAQYQTALRLDPDFVPGLVNLADLERMRGMDQQGATLLSKAIVIEPDNANAHFALGLLLVRQHDPSAIKELRRANELAPNNARYAYVYAVALNSEGATEPAIALLERAHQQHPADPEILVALVSMAQQQGDRPRALRYARELAAIAPGDERVRMLVRRLGGEP